MRTTCVGGGPEGRAAFFPYLQGRRMRDSNPRGREPRHGVSASLGVIHVSPNRVRSEGLKRRTGKWRRGRGLPWTPVQRSGAPK